MAKLRLNLTMSLDGYVAGPRQSLDHPLDGGPAGYECVELASSPVVAHFSYVRRGGA